MEIPLLMLLVLLVVHYKLAQGAEVAPSRDENLAMKRRLELINKPAIKSFVTQHGDILDCVEYHKQLALEHPLLKNHSIQMKPNFKIPKRTRLNDNSSSILTLSQILPKNMKCPKGTVLIKRIQEGDLMMEKYSKLLAFSSSNSSSFAYPNDAPQMYHQVAALATSTPNTGAGGVINLWSPAVKPDQFSDAAFYVRNDDGSVYNAIITGWMVNPYLYPDSTRLFTYWTKDSGQSSGCYNVLCPGFVQTSQQVTLGQILSPISQRGGHQYFVDLTILQDVKTKNWFLLFGQDTVGYWPKELFTTLVHGATKAGWGGEIQTRYFEGPPAMGGGRLAEENYREACLMKWLQLRAPQGFPAQKGLHLYMTNPLCYNILYGKYPKIAEEPPEGDWGNYIFFGGPPDCKYWTS